MKNKGERDALSIAAAAFEGPEGDRTRPATQAEPANTTVFGAAFHVTDEEGTVVAWSLTGVDGGDFSIDDGVLSLRRWYWAGCRWSR